MIAARTFIPLDVRHVDDAGLRVQDLGGVFANSSGKNSSAYFLASGTGNPLNTHLIRAFVCIDIFNGSSWSWPSRWWMNAETEGPIAKRDPKAFAASEGRGIDWPRRRTRSVGVSFAEFSFRADSEELR